MSRKPFQIGLAFVLSLAALPPLARADQPKGKGGEEEMEFEPDEVEKSSPPSKTLERAKKLYDKGDYYSASIEYDKVVKGETDESASNKQRAEFFLAKTLFHMKFFASSLAQFDAIVQQGPAHKYYRKTLQWLAALSKVLPESAGILQKIGAYSREDLEDPALEPVRNELYFLLGRHYYQEGKLDEAIALFQLVPEGSEWYIDAKFMEAVSWVLVPKGAAAVEALKEILVIAREPSRWRKAGIKGDKVREYEELANLTMGRVFYSTRQYDTAIKYFEKLPQDAPDWLASLFEASWAYFMKKGNSKALGNIHTLNAPYFENEVGPFMAEGTILKSVVYFNYCLYDRAEESLTEFEGVYPPIVTDLRKVLKESESDNAAFYQYVVKIRNGSAPLSEKTLKMSRSALSDRTLLKTFAYVEELDREIKQHERSDKAWKTTRVATEVYADLMLQKSLAEDQAGKLARDRLDRLRKELNLLVSDADAVKVAILEAKIGNKRAELQKEQISADHKEEPIIVDDEHQTWDFNGEYWIDELGYYRYRIASRCPRNR
jgi:tetratricopeptide (TPR) repeat protein